MKKLILLAILLLLGIFVGTSFALPVLPAGSIYDTYLHPNDNESGQQDLDVIGNAHYFQIFGHKWSEDSGNSRLEIYLSWYLDWDAKEPAKNRFTFFAVISCNSKGVKCRVVSL